MKSILILLALLFGAAAAAAEPAQIAQQEKRQQCQLEDPQNLHGLPTKIWPDIDPSHAFPILAELEPLYKAWGDAKAERGRIEKAAARPSPAQVQRLNQLHASIDQCSIAYAKAMNDYARERCPCASCTESRRQAAEKNGK